MENRFNNVGVLMGGSSTERAVSLRSGAAVYKALKSIGINCKCIDVVPDEKGAARQISRENIDAAFIVLHGAFGEDGKIQGILESLSIPYTGSSSKASKTAIDKDMSKRCFRDKGINVARDIVLNYDSMHSTQLDRDTIRNMASILANWGGVSGYVIKPATQGSSIGINIVKKICDVFKAVGVASKYDSKVIIEELIEGRELTVGVLDDKVFPVVEIISACEFYDYNAKYQDKQTQYLVPAPLTEQESRYIQEQSLAAHRALGCGGATRVDLIYSTSGVPYILEVNTIPGMTERSLLPKSAEAAGIGFAQLCKRILDMASVDGDTDNYSFSYNWPVEEREAVVIEAAISEMREDGHTIA